MERIIAIGDVHGCIEELKKLIILFKYNPDRDRLIFIGDLVDKGENPKDVVEYILNLHSRYGVEVVGGNHEDIFLNWIDNKDRPLLPYTEIPRVGGINTIKSYFPKFDNNIEEARKFIKSKFSSHISFLRTLPNYIETKNHIFVHAGIDPTIIDWKKTSHNNFRKIRTPFLTKNNYADKQIVFGHTPTQRLHHDKNNNNPWFCGNKIGIDGGCVYGGKLLALEIIEGKKYKYYFVLKS